MGGVFVLLLYSSVYVLAYFLAYQFGGVAERILGWKVVESEYLVGYYVLIAIVLPIILFIWIGIFELFERLGFAKVPFGGYLVALTLLTPFYLPYREFADSKGSLHAFFYTFIYFILPISLSFAIIYGPFFVVPLAIDKLSQFKRKVMVQGTQSETVSSANRKKKGKADKPINFADYGKRMVVGQDHAIETIQKVLIANSKLADLGNPKRQRILASFLFVGPTGVGKTETAKALAGWLEDYGYSSLRLDANQFSDREAVWTLLGSPKGYVGSDKPGLLPYAISQNPKQVILIDEIEKADQGFYQFLLQMLDEGYVIERSTGYRYYLQRAIVIITSNLENKRIAEIMETLKDPIQIDIAVRKTLESAVISFGGGRSFKITPEFLGRIDAIIPFRSLGFEDLVQIAYRELRRLGENVDIDFARALTQKYYPIAREYGVRYFLKKITEDVLTQ